MYSIVTVLCFIYTTITIIIIITFQMINKEKYLKIAKQISFHITLYTSLVSFLDIFDKKTTKINHAKSKLIVFGFQNSN